MNIKNEEACLLAHQVAAETGESLTKAVTVALRERLERLSDQRPAGMAQRLLEIGRDCAPRLRDLPDHGEFLYGKDGLPK